MRKITLLLLLSLLLLSPSLAQAQSAPTLGEFVIQIWPEYDQPSALVIYDFKVAAGTPLPVSVQVRIPKDGNIIAVAQETDQGLLNVLYEPPVTQGDYDVLTLAINDFTYHRIEFYAPLQKNGVQRKYSLIWPGDYAVNQLTVLVQKPFGARNLSTQPSLVENMPSADGFVYAQGSFTAVPVGQPFSISIQYEKDDDTLSIAKQSPSPAGTLEKAQGSTLPITVLLPWLAGGLGVSLIVGGLLWYWQSGRSRSQNKRSSSRRHRSSQPAEDDEASNIYCSQCGKRAEGADRFCRACGARLRRD